jgi:DNA-binding SARP family transcriptional activator
MRDIEFRVLGPLEVLVEGHALELKRRKQRSLLALLLLHTGEVVSTDQLIEELWAGKPPKAAVGSLQNLVSALRKQLGAETVETQAPGYRLVADTERVDLDRFERLVGTAGETEDARRRAELLREALALWRGPALADLVFEPFAQIPIARLEERRTAAREELVAAELELGRHAQLVGELEALVAEHPLRERLRGQLMLALYRAGRQAEALEAYRAARETLVEELGIEPSPELQQLEQSILRHDKELELAARVAVPSAEPEQRKTVTVLFTDVVDSTILGAALDPEVTRAVMRRYFDSVRTIVERHGGVVERSAGDAVLAVFGVPQQHEDDALRAVRAATELGQAITSLSVELEREHGVTIQIRTAINTGEVVSADPTSGQPSATGVAINVAMRLHEAALPAEILLGPTTHQLVRETATTEPVEPVELGGTLGRTPAHRLVLLSETAGVRPPGHASFVGRTDELAQLTTAFEQVRAKNQSLVLTVLGDAGVGKSRLVAELAERLGDQARFVVGRCLSYGEGATYLPLAEIVRQVAPKRPREAIRTLLAGDEDADLVATRLTELTGDTEGASTGEVFWAARRILEAVARDQPLVVVLEDIHWAEPTLLDLVAYLDSWASDAPILMLCLARPTLLEERPGWGRSNAIELQPFSADESIELVAALADERGLPDTVRARIVAVAEGNALFVEQLHAYLTEDVEPGEVESVPPSIEALLASRLDALDAGERRLIERAAVIGRDFPRSALMHLSPPDELAGLESRLASLERRGLIRSLRGRRGGDSVRFHHVLIRDVAYTGTTKERRAGLHERHASWLEARTEPDELVGYHAEQAHMYRKELKPSHPDVGRLAAWAGERLAAAGIRAWKRADTPATINLLGRAAALLPADDAERASVLCELGVAQGVCGDFDAGQATLVEASEAALTGDRRTRLRAQIELLHLRLFSDPEGASAELLELAAKAIPVFEELNDERALGRTWRHVGHVRSMEGRLGDWADSVEEALVHYRRSGWSASGCLAELSSALLHGPTPVGEALERCEDLLDDAADRAGRANVLAFLGGLEALDGRFDDARLHVAESTAIFEELGELHTQANNAGRVLGRIEMLAGDPAAATLIFGECCQTFERMHDAAGLSTVAAELADALYAQGRYDEAAGWLDVAEKRAASDDVSAQWSWRRTRSKLLAREGTLREAEALAREAERIAARTDALSDHGAVLLDVAEVLRLADRPTEAAERIDEALVLFERKGNRVAAETSRALLSELTVA